MIRIVRHNLQLHREGSYLRRHNLPQLCRKHRINMLLLVTTLLCWICVINSDETDQREMVLGELVHQNGTWEQHGVAVLPFEIRFNGILHQLRMRIRNQNPVWIQIWTLTNTIPKFLNLTMKCQWEYRPIELGEVSVNMSAVHPEMTVAPGDYIGIFIPAGLLCPLEFYQIEPGSVPRYSVYGSTWLQQGQEPSIGDSLLFGAIGYIIKHSIEYLFYTEGATSVTMTSPITEETHTDGTTGGSTMSTEPPQTNMPHNATPGNQETQPEAGTTITMVTTSLVMSNMSSDSSLQQTDITVLYASAAVGGSILLVAIIVTSSVLCHKRRQSARRRRFVETDNAIYGRQIPHITWEENPTGRDSVTPKGQAEDSRRYEHSDTVPALTNPDVGIYDTLKSNEIYSTPDETAMYL